MCHLTSGDQLRPGPRHRIKGHQEAGLVKTVAAAWGSVWTLIQFKVILILICCLHLWFSVSVLNNAAPGDDKVVMIPGDPPCPPVSPVMKAYVSLHPLSRCHSLML